MTKDSRTADALDALDNLIDNLVKDDKGWVEPYDQRDIETIRKALLSRDEHFVCSGRVHQWCPIPLLNSRKTDQCPQK